MWTESNEGKDHRTSVDMTIHTLAQCEARLESQGSERT
jgi:hypothetical protein